MRLETILNMQATTMEQEIKTIPQWRLPALLKQSEKHALEWSIERGAGNQYYHFQIEQGFLSMSVSSKTIKRALRILERIITQFYEAGFALTVERNRGGTPASAILYEGEIVPFRIREIQVSQPNRRDSYPSRILVPTGKLELELYAGYFELKPSKLFADTDYTKLEDKIDDIVPYLKEAIFELKQIHLREEERRIQQEEERRLRKEHEQMIRARAAQVKSILQDIFLYEKAKVIQEYCDMVEPLTKSENYLKKIQIARSFADWINPTTTYVDEILSEMFEVKDFL